jgi:hypothetical protein
MTSSHRVFGALALAMATLSGCASDPSSGWAIGHVHESSFKTISVPMFRNLSYDKGLEVDLAKALTTTIEASTPWKVTSAGHADTMLQGTITRVEFIPLSRSVTTGQTSEMIYRVTVDFEWIDLISGETLAARDRFASSAMFVASRPTQEPKELARFQVVQQLSDDLVDAMQADW